MSELDDRYYRASGVTPPSGVVLMLVGGLVAAAVLSAIYSIVTHYNPFIYINFLGTLFLGGLIGLVVLFVGMRGKVRNRMTAGAIGLVIGLSATYMAWVWYVWVLTGYKTMVFSPPDLLGTMQVIAAKGAWSLFSWTPTGFALYTFWIVEAGIVTVTAAIVAAGNDTPYCEICGLWSDEKEDVVRLKNADEALLKQALEEERYEVLQGLPRATRYASDCLHLSLNVCPGCADTNFLTIRHVNKTKDKKGNENIDTRDIIRNLRIPQSVVEDLESPQRPESDEEAEAESS